MEEQKARIFVGIDNGVSGTIGVIVIYPQTKKKVYYYNMPIKSCLNYQKTKVKHITRIDTMTLSDIFKNLLECGTIEKVLIERPMVNPQRFDATTSALRALEATLVVLESFGIAYDYLDSKQWQSVMLPYISVQDKKDYPSKLKEVSKEVGMRLFPNLAWDDFKDADGLLIAEYCKRKEIGI
jgi:hypothetical protein